MRTTVLLLSIAAACTGFVPKIPMPSAVKPLRAETTESEAPAEAEAPAAAAPAEEPAAPTSSASFNPDKVFKVDESPLMAYISRSWNKLDGSDTVEVEEMLKDPATVATIDQPDDLGANALTLAASLNVPKPEIIKALLKAGADVNAKLGEEWSEKDTSALYRAVEGESLECVELIVAAGADLDYMNDRKVFTGLAKMTALQRAEDIGAKKIRDFLKSKGAAAASLRLMNLLDGVEGGAPHAIEATVTHRRQEGDEGEAAERRLSSKYPPVCTQSS